jgi:hypothetical protein
MSGPTTVAFSFAPLGAILLAAEALREAQAMSAEHDEAEGEAETRKQGLADRAKQEQIARLQHQASVRQKIHALEQRAARLRILADTLQLPPAQTVTALASNADFPSWLQYAEALKQSVQHLETTLAEAGRTLAVAQQQSLTLALQAFAESDAESVLRAYAAERSLQPGLNPVQLDTLQYAIGKALEYAGDLPVSPEQEALIRLILSAPSLARAEALLTELRLQIQHGREARHAQEQEAAALVLEQSLRDLGYEVGAISHTLFSEGGVVHFQRPGWEDYHIRMRLTPGEKTLNFNVVRPRNMEESEQRKRLDFIAEERWCSEFPRLMQTLAARGIEFKVLRQLDAGELPVQAVDPASLPARQEEERFAEKPLQKSLNP